MALYLVLGWFETGHEQVQQLSGKVASRELIASLIWIAMHSSPQIQYVDTVRAYHVGDGVQAEVDIVLPPEMTLREAHDVGEALTLRLERLDDVVRAFVHLDYEFDHHPGCEHVYQLPKHVEQRAPDASVGLALKQRVASAKTMSAHASSGNISEPSGFTGAEDHDLQAGAAPGAAPRAGPPSPAAGDDLDVDVVAVTVEGDGDGEPIAEQTARV